MKRRSRTPLPSATGTSVATIGRPGARSAMGPVSTARNTGPSFRRMVPMVNGALRSGELEALPVLRVALVLVLDGEGSTLNININKMSFDTVDNIFRGKNTLKVRTKNILNDLMKRLKKIKGIEKVTRE